MDQSRRYTSKSKRNANLSTKRSGSRSLHPDAQRAYRSKTPQPGHRSKPRKYASAGSKRHSQNTKNSKRLLSYRARNDSNSEKQIEDDLPDYIRATTPQPHIFNSASQRSHSQYHDEMDDDIPSIPSFAPNTQNGTNCMYNFVKTEFEPDLRYDPSRRGSDSRSTTFNAAALPPIPIISTLQPQQSTNTPLPVIHVCFIVVLFARYS